MENSDQPMSEILHRLAPGSPLRTGIDRILETGRGGLIVIADCEPVLQICTGGFILNSSFSPQKLSELSKMDGAIIVDSEVSYIARANVHLIPDTNTETSETGTRHRTAERVARSLHVPVISISESRNDMHIYYGEQIWPVLSVTRLLQRSDQAIQTLERYRSRLDIVSRNLSLLEVDDVVSLQDVLEVIQRAEMANRISTEIERNLVELGTDGRLVRFQLEELMAGVREDRRYLLMDYLDEPRFHQIDEILLELASLEDEVLFDYEALAVALGFGAESLASDVLFFPKGYRLLSKLPRINRTVVESLIGTIGNLRSVLRADEETIAAVPGVGHERAEALKKGIILLVESSFLRRL